MHDHKLRHRKRATQDLEGAAVAGMQAPDTLYGQEPQGLLRDRGALQPRAGGGVAGCTRRCHRQRKAGCSVGPGTQRHWIRTPSPTGT